MLRSRVLRCACALALATLLALTGTGSTAAAAGPAGQPGLFVDRTMPAAQAGGAYRAIGARPQARWFTDGYRTPQQVRTAVADYVGRARAARRTPQLVLYAIPHRDCGGASAGGLPSALAYRAWVRGVARGLDGRRALLVLEPDALAFAAHADCGDGPARLRMLADATRALGKAGARVYIDAGHSDWVDVATTARLLEKAGVAKARGFATNVANFQPTPQVRAWADEVRRELARRGVRDRRYVVDTSRNGASSPVAGDWCNPTWARLGARPSLARSGGMDARLWVKNPGESDGDLAGTCHDGPAAGTWWPAGADRLLGRR